MPTLSTLDDIMATRADALGGAVAAKPLPRPVR
jgi:hypothetical protein